MTDPAPAPPPPPATAPVRWWFTRPGQGLAMLLGLFVVLALYFLSKPPSPSPLIASYIDLLQLKARWAVDDIRATGGASFWLSLLFMVALTVWLALFYIFARGSRLVPDPQAPGRTVRYFAWPHDWPRQVPHRWWVGGAFAAMFFFNVGLFAYFYQVLQGDLMVEQRLGFYLVYTLAIVSRLVGLFLGAGILLQYALNDFGPNVRRFLTTYFPYFYPSVISLAIVGLVFRSLDQFDSLFIDLVQSPLNFIVFATLLFPASIVLIWFTPFYLFFTNFNHGDRQASWDTTRRVIDDPSRPHARLRHYRWLAFHKRLIVSEAAKQLPPTPVPPGFLSHRPPSKVTRPSEGFHRVRAFLGLAYILTLVAICLSIYFDNQRSPGRWTIITLLLITAAVVTYWILAVRQLQLAEREENYAAPPVGSAGVVRKSWVPNWWYDLLDTPSQDPNRRFYYVGNRTLFRIGIAAWLVFGVFFVLTVARADEGSAWQESFGDFLIFLTASLFVFVWLTVYRRFYSKFTFAEERRVPPATPPDPTTDPADRPRKAPAIDVLMDRLDHLSVQVMLWLNPLLAGLALVYFLFGLLYPPFMSEVAPRFNPLNIYLLLVNGLIGFLILLDRFLLLWEQDKQYTFYRKPENRDRAYGQLASHNFFWGAALVLVLLLVTYLGNSYHEIDYDTPISAVDPPPDLLSYTRTYLDRYDPSKPILFVAADGGGLKACYWTMLNLQRLDSLGLYDNVFLLSGASGGNIGLAMYTYLKARNLSAQQVRPYIERIGDANFLSGDFTGLLTRFPLNYFPDVPGYAPNRWEDRSEAMARAYFDIVGGRDPSFGYDVIRRAPYAAIWQRRDYALPLFVANTTRAEDGMRGIVHPLRADPALTAGLLDLSTNDDRYISYPDAAFLANRFPVMSPVGRIPGKGHFIDAGAADNSGIGTIYHFLQYMKASAAADSTAALVYDRFFADSTRRVLVSLRNDKTRFIRDQFYSQIDSLNRTVYQSEIVANTNAAVNTGLSGVPNFWDDFLRSPVPGQLGLLDTFLAIDLPFRLRKYDVHTAFSGELSYRAMREDIRRINDRIETTLGCDEDDDCYIVAPPLGRLLAAPSRHYMRRMVEYPDNRAAVRALSGR